MADGAHRVNARCVGREHLRIWYTSFATHAHKNARFPDNKRITCVYSELHGIRRPTTCVFIAGFTFVKQSSSRILASSVDAECVVWYFFDRNEQQKGFRADWLPCENVLFAVFVDYETLKFVSLINRRRRSRTLYNLFSLTHRFAFYLIEWRSGVRAGDFIAYTFYESLVCESCVYLKCKLM